MPKPKEHQGIERVCIICNASFRTWQYNIKIGKGKYCSKKCSNIGKAQHSSPMKGKKHTVESRKKMSEALKGRHCSPKTEFRKGNKPANYKGFSVHTKGYIWIHSPKHPFCDSRGYVLEHRLVMEQYIERYLTRKELVHHINENTSDNRIENLKLFSDNKTHLQHHALLRRL